MDFEVTMISSVFANAYLLTGSRVALVDTLGRHGHRMIERALRKKNMGIGDIEFILLTHHHFDHAGSAAFIQEASGAHVIAGEEDSGVIEGSLETPLPGSISLSGRLMGKIPAPVLRKYQSYPRVTVDRKVNHGDFIEELGLETVGMPGHTPGGMCYFEPVGKRAFAGDIVFNYFARPGMPLLASSYSVSELKLSQQRLVDLGIEQLYPGHGAPITSDAARRIALLASG